MGGAAESDLAYYQRALTRIYRLAGRTDLPVESRLAQILEQASEALERPSGDGEVIEQLKQTVGELKSKAIDLIAMEKEAGMALAQLAASERERRMLEEQISAADISSSQSAAFARFEDMGCALLMAGDDDEFLSKVTRVLRAAAKRAARELDDDEARRRGLAAAEELLEI